MDIKWASYNQGKAYVYNSFWLIYLSICKALHAVKHIMGVQ